MNFLEIPTPGLEENAKMNDEEENIATIFANELIALGVLEEVSAEETSTNT